MYSSDQDSKILALDSQGFGGGGWWGIQGYFLIGWVAQSFRLHTEFELDIDDFLSFITRNHTGSREKCLPTYFQSF